jgi:hypothetical protein
MKLYYFILSALGIMILLYLGGVNTGSGSVVNSLLFNNVSNIQISNNQSITQAPQSFDFSSNLFYLVTAIIGAFALVGAVSKIAIGQFQIQSNLDGLYALVGGAFWVLFAQDIVKVLINVYGITGGIGWEFWIISILSVTFLLGFFICILEFIRGND